MSDILSFDIIEEDGYEACPRVADFPTTTPDMIVGGNPLVTERTTIQINFDYPLSRPVCLEFSNPHGFTCYDFFKAVYDGYSKIYREEDAQEGDPGMVDGMFNRNSSEGAYGIWGHYMEDLFLEGFREVEPGVYNLGIGS